MARSIRNTRRNLSRRLRPTPYPLPSHHMGVSEKDCSLKKIPLTLEKEDWQDATCSVCMESPHNAVLLLCSSHDKGCHPYMCGTSYRHSNCLDQFKKAYAKVMPSSETNVGNQSHSFMTSGWPTFKKSGGSELACPLCRGQVKGWTIMEPAREYLNKKKRSCMQDNCSFMGTYKELQKHVRAEHPLAGPRKVDPALEQKWMLMERQREREDIISTIRSSNPRSVVLGDYVIEMDDSDSDTDGEDLGEGARGLRGRSHNISFLYFLFQEGARLTRLHRDNRASDAVEDGVNVLPMEAAATTDSSEAYPLAGVGDDDSEVNQGMLVNMFRSERRRRRRSRGRSASGVS
ncbi:hypothetical protein J5N97_019580 [Dioscorea zingiberensis]|uniref:Uncharacterized protein n=1 Tax=Dioscorea zingiberensis TaxID=325984 RepID=A0A9D5CE91_9LILI|nr:hypothetical protein J5N97_019580 [Dioscorea zingiberensis]